MNANNNKCHLLVNSKEKMCARIVPCNISKQQKLLETLIDDKG